MFRKITLLLLCCYTTFISIAQEQNDFYPVTRPKLIVGIQIDGMNYDYLYRYWETFSNKGIKKLANQGAICKNTRIPYFFTDNAAGYASIVTGTTPSHHGIIGNKWYDKLKEEIVFCTNENKIITTIDQKYPADISPARMIASTFMDELKLGGQPTSKVISISLDSRAAILNGGHMADAAYWFDDRLGIWTTGTYYSDSLPMWVWEFNQKKLIDVYLESEWKPLLALDQYYASENDNSRYETGINNQNTFPYILEALKEKFNYKIVPWIPAGNTYTKDLAIAAINNEKLGKDRFTDVLMLTFSVTQKLQNAYGPRSMEMQDAYLRLDEEIGHLLEYIESSIGKDKVLVFLTSPYGDSDLPAFISDNSIPSGYFKSNQAIYLLKTYLNVFYPNLELIKYYYQQQIYLDHKVIEDARLSVVDIQNKIADFIIQFSGVSNVLTATNIQNNSYDEGFYNKIKSSYSPRRSADVFIILEPGWIEQVGQEFSQNHNAEVPLIWYGWKIKPQTIRRPVSITDIAPSISYMMNLPFPNSCTGNPMTELIE